MRLLHSLLLAGGLVMAAVPVTHADDSDAISAAYADMTLFMLNVANGHDGAAQNTDRENDIRANLTQDFATLYPTLTPDLQQSLEQLPQLDLQVQQTYAALPADQRAALRDQFAAQVEDMEGNVTCPEYDALVRANLTPDGQYHDLNVKRLSACWRAHPELAKDTQGNQVAPPPAGGGGGNHALFMSMMNMNMMSYAASMNVANNFGDGPYTYTVK